MQQSEMITQKESQSILRLAQDCSSSLVGLEDIASFISENTAAISTQFEFDDVLRSTLLYQTAERSHLRQAIRAKKTKDIERASTDSLIRQPAAFGFRQAFQTMRLSKPIVLSDILKTQQGIRDAVRHKTIIEEEPPQEDSLRSNPGDSEGAGSSAKTRQPTQSLRSGSDSNSPRPRSSFGNWRKSFQHQISNAHDTQPHQHQQKKENSQPEMPKVLLLGASGGGKTTLLNALQLFTEPDRIKRDEGYFRTLVWYNALNSVRVILRAMEGCPDIEGIANARTLLLDPCHACGDDPALNPEHAREVARVISSLRLNKEFQKAIELTAAYQFHDNGEYYIKNINRLAEQAVHCSAPTNEDLLRTRVTTTDIHQVVLTYKDFH